MEDRAAPSSSSLRLFVALHVPADQAERLVDRAESIARGSDEVRVPDASTIHVTWAFLGSVDESHLPEIARALDAAAAEVPGPTLCSVGLAQSFGGGRVLGADVEIELLAPLGAARDAFLGDVAPLAPHADHRPWHPHVTILRTRRSLRRLPAHVHEHVGTQVASGNWVAGELRLYASLPGPDGSQHRVLHAAAFGAHVAAR
jgi:2'-5' RNA ligase